MTKEELSADEREDAEEVARRRREGILHQGRPGNLRKIDSQTESVITIISLQQMRIAPMLVQEADKKFNKIHMCNIRYRFAQYLVK